MGSNPTADILDWRRFSQCHYEICPREQTSSVSAAIAQLGERQTEDLEVLGSIPGLGNLSFVSVTLQK